MNSSLRTQQTVARPVAVTGRGYWSGLEATIEFRPAAVDSGLCFVRADLPDQPRIAACVGNRVDIPLRTVLAQGTACVEMVEHILAALVGAGVDNCDIWVDRAEMPGMDGSSLAFTQALEQAGVVAQAATRPRLVVREPIQIGDDSSWLLAEPARHGEYHVEYQLNYDNCRAIGAQTFGVDIRRETFARELAPARTFLLASEAQWLREQGLGRSVSYQDLLVFDDQGPIENELRFGDECVRHKALDVVGDLALAGFDLVGRFTAHRSGHRLNAEMVRALLRQADFEEVVRKTA